MTREDDDDDWGRTACIPTETAQAMREQAGSMSEP